jgi:hypothetical protein
MSINNTFIESKRARSLSFWLAIVFALLVSFGLRSVEPAHAAIRPPFTVNSTEDYNDLDFPDGVFDGSSDGRCDVDAGTPGRQCTLRAAIQQANRSRGADTIAFNIPSSRCNATTRVCFLPVYGTSSDSRELPRITKPVTIDGYTQGDATADPADDATQNTLTAPGKTNADLKIVVYGEDVGSVPDGLVLDGASNSVIRGLVLYGFDDWGIKLLSGAGYRIQGNFIGTDPSGNLGFGGADNGVRVYTSSTTIGGASPAARNIISFNRTAIHLIGGVGDRIQGNLIGTNANGTNTPHDLGNVSGIVVESAATNNTIGDSDPSDGLTNAANTIAFNDNNGVTLEFGVGTGNRILSNSIFSNGGLGIDLLGNGVTTNDGDDPNTPNPDPDKDTGPNRLQNYPVITSAQNFGDFTSINGTLNSTPSTNKKTRTFLIQFFSSPVADPSGFGEGETFIGQRQVTTNRQGDASFNFAPFQKVPTGQFITATATNKKTGDTSEFSGANDVDDLGGG